MRAISLTLMDGTEVKVYPAKIHYLVEYTKEKCGIDFGTNNQLRVKESIEVVENMIYEAFWKDKQEELKWTR